MPKLKISDDDLDIEELEEAEYEDSYEPYDGPEPPKGTVLGGYIKRIYWTYTSKDDPMLKVLFVADENTGAKAKYNGWNSWDNITLTASAKFRWKPFVDAIGITLRDLKTKTIVESEDDPNLGAPIVSIARWKPGEDQDGAWARVLTKMERGEYAGAKVDRWLEYAEAAADDEDDEEEIPDDEEIAEEEEAEGEAEETEEEEEAEEEAEEPTPPAKSRGRSTQAPARGGKVASGRGAKPAAKASAARPAASGRRTAARPAADKGATSKPAARGRGGRRASGADDDPPF